MSIGLRIKELRKDMGMSQTDFADAIGIKQSPLSQMESNKILPSIETLQKIIRVFNIEYKWLIDGSYAKPNVEENLTISKGKIKGKVKSKKPNVQKKVVMVEQDSPTGAGFSGKKKGDAAKMQEVEGPVGGIPLIPVDAMAGFGAGEMTVMGYETSRYVVPEFEEMHVDFMISVKGSSMYPKYNSGDIVACKKLSLKDLFFQWNKVYVLDTVQGALIKRIKKGKDKNHIVLHSDNPYYDPFELHISKVNAIAIVMGVIRLE